jgi:hypothetical protein
MSTVELHPTALAPFTPPEVNWQRTHVTRQLVVEGDVAEAIWEMYEEAFTPLDELAAQRHLWTREEVLAELANPAIVKFIGWSGDRPVGLAMITNELELVPMISPAFLRRRFPEQATRNAIFYGIVIFVRPGFRGKTLFARLGSLMGQETARHGGVVLFDVCSYNREHRAVDDNLSQLAVPFPNSSMMLVDQQSWFAIELPEPLDEAAGRLRVVP